MGKRHSKTTDFESFLTWEALVEILSYDPATGEFTWRKDVWGKVKSGKPAGCKNKNNGYLQIYITGRSFYGHRLAYLYMTKHWPSDLIDHKNGDKSDNSWHNLRPATSAQNGANTKLHSTNKSGVRGVSWHPCGKWRARVEFQGKQIHIGLFDTIEEAAAARESFNVTHIGDFTRRVEK